MTLGHYCTARREGGRIILEIPEDKLLAYFSQHDPEFPTVEEPEQFFPALLPRLLDTVAPTRDDESIPCLDQFVRRAAIATAMDGHGATLNPEEPLNDREER